MKIEFCRYVKVDDYLPLNTYYFKGSQKLENIEYEI